MAAILDYNFTVVKRGLMSQFSKFYHFLAVSVFQVQFNEQDHYE